MFGHSKGCSVPMSGDSDKRRYDVVAETRRVWSPAEKRAIVTEASLPDVNVSAIARRHGMKPSLLFRWKTQLADAIEVNVEPTDCRNGQGPSFVPIALAAPTAPSAQAASDAQPLGTIEIDLSNGRRVRVGGSVDVGLLKLIIDVLEGR
ncbi:MAG: IS66-like element accessory protein TnpA [Steroidobacteraceae bacterium]